jgi:hypothetical protein
MCVGGMIERVLLSLTSIAETVLQSFRMLKSAGTASRAEPLDLVVACT